MRQFLRRLLIALLGMVVLQVVSLLSPGGELSIAHAHAFVIGSDPVDGGLLSAPPKMVRIFFDAPISAASRADVFAPAPGGQLRLVDAAQSSVSPSNPRELDTPLSTPDQLAQGGYLVRWTALSSVDGHTTHGTIGFDVGRSSTGLPGEVIVGPSTSNIPPTLDVMGGVEIAWHWLVLLALVGWVGLLATQAFLLTQHKQMAALLARVSTRGDRLEGTCLGVLLVGEVCALVLRAMDLVYFQRRAFDLLALAGVLAGTTYGQLWLFRLACLLLALGVLWWTTHRPGRTTHAGGGRRAGSRFGKLRRDVVKAHGRPVVGGAEALGTHMERLPSSRPLVLRLALAGLVLLTLALTGDAAQIAQPHMSAVVLDWLYLVTQGLCFGGAAALAFVLVPTLARSEPAHAGRMLAALLRRVLPWAVGTLILLVGSFLLLGEASLSGWHQLLSEPYGQALLVSGALLALLLALSAYVLYSLRPQLARTSTEYPLVEGAALDEPMQEEGLRQPAGGRVQRRLVRILRVQSELGAALLLCAALMAFFAPPIVFPAQSYATRSNTETLGSGAPELQTQQVGDLTFSVQVLPGRVNAANTVVVTLRDASGRLVSDAQLQLTTTMQVMDMGTARMTIPAGHPTYVATFKPASAFSMPGVWLLTVTVRHPQHPMVQARFEIVPTG